MRPEQIEKLVSLEEELVDVYIHECQPKKWPGMKKAADRGDRYWHKKNALATLTLVGRIQTVLRDARTDGGAGGGEGKVGEPKRPDDTHIDIEAEAAALEKQGVAVLKRHAKRRR